VSRVMREGDDVAVLAFGDRVGPALEAAETLAEEGVSVRVVDMRWVKPLDERAVIEAADTKLVVTVENGILQGGAGDGVLELLSKRQLNVSTLQLAVDDRTVPHGKPALLHAELGIDGAGIAEAIRARLA